MEEVPMNSHFIRHCAILAVMNFMAINSYADETGGHGSHHEPSCPAGPDHHVDLGHHRFEISSSNHETQRLFNEGMVLAYGFNHAAAGQKFRKAAESDPQCAMCYWGIAYILGPNINMPMESVAVPQAYEAVQKALDLMDNATEREQAYIRTMAERYQKTPPEDRSELDRRYASMMIDLARRYPQDLDATVLAVEAMMDTTPWNYWLPDGRPREGTEEMIGMLNRVLKINPLHPGANHFLIHIVEKERPELGEEAADRLVDLVPGAGHLQHMASHIYIRVGRYHDAVLVNLKGIEADRAYLTRCPQNLAYESLYIPHNYDFLIAAASLEGNKKLALQTAQEMRKLVEPMVYQHPENFDLQQLWSVLYLTYVRFEHWRAMLDEAAPPQDWTYAQALWHYGRALALAKTGSFDDAAREISTFEDLAQLPEMTSSLLAALNPASHVLSIGVEEAKGELALMQKDTSTAIKHLQKAVELQDGLAYMEPPPWYRSTRLSLGAALLAAGRYGEAQKAFAQDLEEFPANGWALYGLYQSYTGQGLVKKAAATWKNFKQAWRYADFNLKKSLQVNVRQKVHQ
jgi:tetratricopeptide (TPR) repeat protein